MDTIVPDSIDPALCLSNKYTLNSKSVVSSAYWKVPDSKSHLTAVACHDTDPLVAVASGSRDSNLFIYEVSAPQEDHLFPPEQDGYHGDCADEDINYYKHTTFHRSNAIQKRSTARKIHKRSVSENSALPPSPISSPVTSQDQQVSPILTHHQTITLGGIHSLAWVSSKHHLGAHGDVLATGHNSGLLHFVMLPDPYANNGPAEILHRFNHSRHLSPEKVTSSRIRTINLASSAWNCCPQSSIVSLFSEHLYMWDPARPETPIVIQRTRRARSLNISPLRNGIVSLATDRGVSIMDVRYKNPVALAPPNDNDGLVSLVKWSSIDENRVASVHDQTLIKIWDIRTGSPLVCLEGHYDKINSIEWSTTSADEFCSASADGTVRIWDIKKCTDLDDSNNSFSSRNNSSIPSSLSSPSTPQSGRRHIRSRSEDYAADWLPSQSWRLYRQRLARENSLPSYNYFLDNQNPQSPCTTIFSNNKEFIGLATVHMPVHGGVSASSRPHLVSIDNSGFFGIHSKIGANDEIPIKQDEISGEIADMCTHPYSAKNPLTQRPSLESLASLSSNSAGDGSLDHQLDDSTSDTSSSIPSSPRTEPRRDSAEIFIRTPSPTRRTVSDGSARLASSRSDSVKPLFIANKLPDLPPKSHTALGLKLDIPGEIVRSVYSS